jgi:hypothetical protein
MVDITYDSSILNSQNWGNKIEGSRWDDRGRKADNKMNLKKEFWRIVG